MRKYFPIHDSPPLFRQGGHYTTNSLLIISLFYFIGA
jgi:hypothetical protein